MDLQAQTSIEIIATICFACAIFHTFTTKYFAEASKRFPDGSAPHNLLHFFSEVEVVFGLWAFVFLLILSGLTSTDAAVKYLESVTFTEAVFVFVIMTIASTKPVLAGASSTVSLLVRLSPRRFRSLVWYASCLSICPLFGSFITEPAAMTVSVLLLMPMAFDSSASQRLRYSTLAGLFVNISIGGTLTHFAAPPVVMVAEKWGWDLSFMVSQFGPKAIAAVVVNTFLLVAYNHKEIVHKPFQKPSGTRRPPRWTTLIHLLFLALVVRYHSSMSFFVPLFLLFIGWDEVTIEHQDELKLRESLLVGFFLGGLVVLGQMQGWWIKPLFTALSPATLYTVTTGLTAITDNAALTFLATLVPNLSNDAKLFIVSGAVVGGGLTVIANAPNPIGIGLVKDTFEDGSVSAIKLIVYALIPTAVAYLSFFYL